MMIFITSNKAIKKLMIIVFWLLIWQAVFLWVDEEILFVSPFGVLKAIIELSQEGIFWKTIGFSVSRVMVGYGAGVVVAIVVAILTSLNPLLFDLFYPLISMIKATPVASFIILALVWLKTGTVPVFISFLMVFPIVWANICEGIKNTDEKLIQMANVYQFSIWKKVKLIYFPSIIPYFTAACLIGLGLAWKSGIAAEIISTPPHSIGSELYNAKIYFETQYLFAWTTVVIIMSVAIEKLFGIILKKLSSKYNL